MLEAAFDGDTTEIKALLSEVSAGNGSTLCIMIVLLKGNLVFCVHRSIGSVVSCTVLCMAAHIVPLPTEPLLHVSKDLQPLILLQLHV